MTHYCDCEIGRSHIMEQIRSYREPDFSSTNNMQGRMATRRVYKCPVCGRERVTDGHGKEVKK